MGEPYATLDGLLPPQIAAKAEEVGVNKGRLPLVQTLMLSILAGAFVGLAAMFCTVVLTGNGVDGAIRLPYGVVRVMGGVAFSLGLILVIVAGAELFTGNTLMVMAVANRKLSLARLAYNWSVVYVGNLIGSVVTAYLVLLTEQHRFAAGEVGKTAMAIADAKCGLAFLPAMASGVYANALVCLAVWLCMSCRSTTDKILAIVFPITAFVACGFEHSVANMYFIPMGLFVAGDAAFWAERGVDLAAYSALSWSGFVRNLIPVTIGNVIGGAFFVGGVYWTIYSYAAPKEE